MIPLLGKEGNVLKKFVFTYPMELPQFLDFKKKVWNGIPTC